MSSRDRRLKKLSFDGSVPKTSDWDAAWNSTERVAAPAAGTVSQKPDLQNVASPPKRSLPPHGKEAGEARWTIPIHVSISVGEPLQRSHAPEAQISGEAENRYDASVEAVVVDQDYSDRPGYDPDFLQRVSFPLPGLKSEMLPDAAVVADEHRVHDNPNELAYYHYSVYMNKKRRTAWFSAANVDGDRRPPIGKRQGDRWYSDTRIRKTEQLGQDAFEHGIDRGLVMRREDTAWGR